ncbi:MAG: hypothetical protein A3B70_02710 [Deltaproteobacteria bacterium RIFCSPHIGHO2_02_FULL_40_11]|nr:MAG: hypothetical protein A3B70_02710 [Deltaproteobacteria bacterium RIFCSPHIGHO2_02_FULL_40_11]
MLNFGTIVQGRFYRSAQPDRDDLKYYAKKYKIRTILNLRFQRNIESFEVSFANKKGIQFISIPMDPDEPPTPEQLNQYFDLLLNGENYPIWMHCKGGADRTGIMAALYRIEFLGWSKNDAITEMISFFHFPPAHPNLIDFIHAYDSISKK